MADFPAGVSLTNPTMILGTNRIYNSPVAEYTSTTRIGWSAATWAAANRAHFLPILVHYPMTAYQLAIYNGAVTASTNIDVGIYDTLGNRLVSAGTAAQGSANSVQTFNITDTLLNPGVYYLGANVSQTATSTFFRCSPTVSGLRFIGVQISNLGSAVLPSTVTFANPSNGYCPLITMTASVV